MKTAILIPTKSRPNSLIKLFKKCPVLNHPDTFVGIESEEKDLYREWKLGAKECTIVWINNPDKMVGTARQQLKLAAQNSAPYERYVSTDDNIYFSENSMRSLLLAQEKENCIMAGTGAPFSLWYKDAIQNGKYYSKINITTYAILSTVFWCIPGYLYNEFSYPTVNCFYDDTYFALWCITRKHYTNFRCCLQAKYSKTRFEEGGNGSSQERFKKMAIGMLQLAEHFPDVINHSWLKQNFQLNSLIEKRTR